MRRQIVIFAFSLTTVFSVLGCGPAADGPTGVENAASIAANTATANAAKRETLSPEETLARLAQLARAGDWESYVDDFYGETHKFEGISERRDTVVAKFRDNMANGVLARFKRLEGKSAEIVDDGKKAVFEVDGEPLLVLYLSDDGRWTFHL